MASELIDGLGELEVLLGQSRAINVNDSGTKKFTIDLASEYFKTHRPGIHQTLGDNEELTAYDTDWQGLIRLAHSNNARSSYRKVIRRLKRRTAEISIAGLTQPPPAVEEPNNSIARSDHRLLETLEDLVPSAAASYKQGLLDVSAGADRVSYRGTASEFRETLRETLDHLAPDADVRAAEGFKLEANQTKSTMKQKVRYVLSARGANQTRRNAAEKSIELVESLAGEIARAVYNRASLSTHVQTTRQEVLQIKRYVATVLYDLLEITE